MVNNEIKLTCKNIERDFYKNKHWRKKVFLTSIKLLSFFLGQYQSNTPNSKQRAEIIRLCYMYFREIDDLIDGDKLLPDTPIDFNENKKIIIDYMQQRRQYLENGCINSNPNDLDQIIKIIIEMATTIGFDLQSDCLKLLDCMLFDLERKCDLKNGIPILSSNDDIDKYFFQYYYQSSINIFVRLTKSSNLTQKNLRDIGYAQRTYMNLIDFFEDLSLGIINIPVESITSLGIKEESLIKIAQLPKETINLCKNRGFNHPSVITYISDPILEWLYSQLDQGLQYLYRYQSTAPLRSKWEILEEILFYHFDASELCLRLGFEFGTNNYLKKLDYQRQNKKRD